MPPGLVRYLWFGSRWAWLICVFYFANFASFCIEMSTTVSKNAVSPKGGEKRIREQGVRLKYLLMKSAMSAGMLLGVWLVGYFQYSVTWVLVPSFVYVGIVEFRKSRKASAGVQDDEQSLLGRVEELPSWVSIPMYVCMGVTKHRTGRTAPQNRYILSIERRLFSSHF